MDSGSIDHSLLGQLRGRICSVRVPRMDWASEGKGPSSGSLFHGDRDE